MENVWLDGIMGLVVGDALGSPAQFSGLAGLYYGYESIPAQWVKSIVKREYIESMCNMCLAK